MTGQDQIDVVIVDDDPLVRSALTLMLGGQPDITVVGDAADGRAGIALVRDLRPDVVLMDIRMPRLDGLAASGIRRTQPASPASITWRESTCSPATKPRPKSTAYVTSNEKMPVMPASAIHQSYAAS